MKYKIRMKIETILEMKINLFHIKGKAFKIWRLKKMAGFKRDGIVIFGSSKDIFPDKIEFDHYLESLIDGSWLKNYGHLTNNQLTYLRYTKRPTNRCLFARILLLTYAGFLKAEIHVKPAIKYKPPIKGEKLQYHLGYTIKEDENGPLVFILKESLKASEIPNSLGFPYSYRAGAYVNIEAVEYIRQKGRRERFTL